MWEIKINELLYNPESIFGIIFECIGEAPALIPFCYALVVIIGIIFNKYDFRKRKWELLLFSSYLLMAVALTVALVEVTKVGVNRVRFYDLTPPNYPEYTPFYKVGYGGRSFPSGHASMSALSFLILDVNDNHKIFRYKWILVAFCTVFTSLVALSRLVAGAHYVTDIIFGILIALTTRLILKKAYSSLAVNL